MVVLDGEAVEIGAVVRDDELELGGGLWTGLGHRPFGVDVEEGHTSSMRAMGALSPGRGPSLRMRT